MQPITALVKAALFIYIIGDSPNISSKTLTCVARSSYNINKRYYKSVSFLFNRYQRLAYQGWGRDVFTDIFIVYISFFVNISVYTIYSV